MVIIKCKCSCYVTEYKLLISSVVDSLNKVHHIFSCGVIYYFRHLYILYLKKLSPVLLMLQEFHWNNRVR